MPIDLVAHGVSAQLVRRSTEPLFLVGPHAAVPRPPAFQSSGFANLVARVDGSLQLTEVLAATTRWARLPSARVHVVKVGPPEPGGLPTYPTAELVATHLADRDIEATWVLIPNGHPAGQIVDFAAGLPDPLLVVGTHGQLYHHGRAALGRVSRGVVRHAASPVLVVPPAGVPEA